MARLVVQRGEFTPTDSVQSKYCADHVQQRADDEVVAALFCGPWCEQACDAYTAALVPREGENASKNALLAAADALDRRVQSMTEEDRWELWGGTACGTVLTIANGVFRCAWLGDCQVFLVRNHIIQNLTKTHTVYQALVDARNESPDPKMKHVLMRWLSRQHEVDVAEWPVQLGDTILLCSSHVGETNVVHALESQTPHNLAQEIACLAGEQYRRITHCVLVIDWSVS